MSNNVLPVESKERKNIPLCRGVLDYFPAALAYVAQISKAGNDKHNPGEDLHWARGKSTDHADCIIRHLVDRGKIDPEDNLRHSGKVAWRALALLQEELEAAGAPVARGARVPEPETVKVMVMSPYGLTDTSDISLQKKRWVPSYPGAIPQSDGDGRSAAA